MRVVILLTCGKHLHDHIISLREVWVHKTSLKLPLVPSQENERSSICVLGVSIFPLSAILIFDFGSVSTMWFFMFFILYLLQAIASHHFSGNRSRSN